MARAGRAVRAFRSGGSRRRKPIHAPAGVTEGGQFIGRSSVLHAVVRALTGGAGGGEDVAPSAAKWQGKKRPALLRAARARALKLPRGLPDTDVRGALRAHDRKARGEGATAGDEAFRRELAAEMDAEFAGESALRDVGHDDDVVAAAAAAAARRSSSRRPSFRPIFTSGQRFGPPPAGPGATAEAVAEALKAGRIDASAAARILEGRSPKWRTLPGGVGKFLGPTSLFDRLEAPKADADPQTAYGAQAQFFLDNWGEFGALHGMRQLDLLGDQPDEVLRAIARGRGVPMADDKNGLVWLLAVDAGQHRVGEVREFDDVPDVFRTMLGGGRGQPPAAAVAPPAPPRPRRGKLGMLDAALARWQRGSGSSDPFKSVQDREPLRRFAKARGIKLPRGADRDRIVAEILADARGEARRARDDANNPAAGVMPGAPIVGGRSKFHRDVAGVQGLIDGVQSGVKSRKKLSGGMIGETSLVTFGDGSRAVHKIGTDHLIDVDPALQASSEQLGSLVARAMGIEAPRVYRHNDHEIYMEFVDDAVTGARADGDVLARAHDSDQGRLIGILDLITGNWDRNPGNYMITGDGRPVPIDHGLLWNLDDPMVGQTGEAPGRVSPFARHFVGGGGNPFAALFGGGGGGSYQDHDMSPDDMAEIRRRLEALRPDFQHVGQEAWLDFSLRRLDALTLHAKGKFNRVAPGGPPRPRERVSPPQEIFDLAGQMLQAPPGRRRRMLAQQRTSVLRQFPAAHAGMWDSLGGQTAIEAMGRGTLEGTLRRRLAPGPADLARGAQAQLDRATHWAWEGEAVFRKQPVAVLRELARMQGPDLVARLGGEPKIAKMAKADLVREMRAWWRERWPEWREQQRRLARQA